MGKKFFGFFSPLFLRYFFIRSDKMRLKCTNLSWNASYLLVEMTMSAISYLVSVRILSVSSISHLFHAIERQSQADEKQEAADKRRHRVRGNCALPLRVLRRQLVSIQVQPLLVQREEGRTRKEPVNAPQHPCDVQMCSCDPASVQELMLTGFFSFFLARDLCALCVYILVVFKSKLCHKQQTRTSFTFYLIIFY